MDAATADQLIEFLTIAAHVLAFGVGVVGGVIR